MSISIIEEVNENGIVLEYGFTSKFMSFPVGGEIYFSESSLPEVLSIGRLKRLERTVFLLNKYSFSRKEKPKGKAPIGLKNGISVSVSFNSIESIPTHKELSILIGRVDGSGYLVSELKFKNTLARICDEFLIHHMPIDTDPRLMDQLKTIFLNSIK